MTDSQMTEERPARYEYCMRSFAAIGTAEDEMNKLGREGWEHYFYWQTAMSYRFFFRRPL